MNAKRERDEITARAMGLSYSAFVERRAQLRAQAASQRPGRKMVFRFIAKEGFVKRIFAKLGNE